MTLISAKEAKKRAGCTTVLARDGCSHPDNYKCGHLCRDWRLSVQCGVLLRTRDTILYYRHRDYKETIKTINTQPCCYCTVNFDDVMSVSCSKHTTDYITSMVSMHLGGECHSWFIIPHGPAGPAVARLFAALVWGPDFEHWHPATAIDGKLCARCHIKINNFFMITLIYTYPNFLDVCGSYSRRATYRKIHFSPKCFPE